MSEQGAEGRSSDLAGKPQAGQLRGDRFIGKMRAMHFHENFVLRQHASGLISRPPHAARLARPVRLTVRTPDFHSGNRGSIPLRVANFCFRKATLAEWLFCWSMSSRMPRDFKIFAIAEAPPDAVLFCGGCSGLRVGFTPSDMLFSDWRSLVTGHEKGGPP